MLTRRTIREAAFSWNIALVLGCALLNHVLKSFLLITETGYFEGTDAGYWFRRAAIRSTDLLHVGTPQSVAANRDMIMDNLMQQWTGYKLIVLLSFFAATVILFFSLKVVARTWIYRVALNNAALTLAWLSTTAACLWMWVWNKFFILYGLSPMLLSLLAAGALLSPLSLIFRPGESTVPSRPNRWTYAAAILSFLALAYLWLPGYEHDLSHPHDINSVKIELSRGPCFGGCAAYQITIEGNGSVTFRGIDAVRIATISREQIEQLLADFQRIRFFTIEDRAFGWCSDTPSVGISLSIDGKSKHVAADVFCVGAKSGVQAGLAKLATEIDTVTGSERWFDLARPSRRRTNPPPPTP